MNSKVAARLAGLALVGMALAGCNNAVTGEVIGNGVSETACKEDASLSVAVSVLTNEVAEQADGKMGRIIKVVCLPPQDAAQYPLGSTYPKS